jgi:hypothetical protein
LDFSLQLSSYSPILKQSSTLFQENNGRTYLELYGDIDFQSPTVVPTQDNPSPKNTTLCWKALIDAMRTDNMGKFQQNHQSTKILLFKFCSSLSYHITFNTFVEKAHQMIKVLNEQCAKPSHYLHYRALLEYYASSNNNEMFQQLVNEIKEQKLLRRHFIMTILSYYTNQPNAEELVIILFL